MSVPIVKMKSVKSGSQDWCETGKDQKKVHSESIGSRLAQAMAVRGWSQTDLADALGITNNTLGRIIAGQERLNMNICCRAMELMDFEPRMLLSDEPITGDWTGITAIDAMLSDIYGEMSQSGIDSMGKYVTKDYLCCSHHYTETSSDVDLRDGSIWEACASQSDKKLRKRVYQKERHGREMIGIPYDLERKNNVEIYSNGACFIRKILSAALIGEDRVFVETAAEWKSFSDGTIISKSKKHFFEILYLKNTMMSISSGASVRIRRKVWWYKAEN